MCHRNLWKQAGIIFIVVNVICLLTYGNASGVKTWTVGGKDHPWSGAGTLRALQETKTGWIEPEQADSTKNLLVGIMERGGSVRCPQQPLWTMGEAALTDDSGQTGWWVRSNVRGTSLEIDLGAVFSVNKIVMTTLPGAHAEDPSVWILRAYEIWVNDGNPKNVFAGSPIYSLLVRNPQNDTTKIIERFPTQYVRYIKVKALTDHQFAVHEMGVYGTGYISVAQYISNVIDLGDRANFGRVELSTEIDPKAKIVLRTRTGTTPVPSIYHKKTGIGDQEVVVSKKEYDSLPSGLKGTITEDTENWSTWSPAYPAEGGRMLSPGNRRYLQFSLDFLSTAYTDRARVNFVSFEYSTPTMAHEIVAEISPESVNMGETTTFTYYVLPTIFGSDTGFDALEILTPSKAMVKSLKIGGLPETDFTVQPEADRLRIFFPNHRLVNDELLVLTFECTVTVSGTQFNSKALDVQTGELPQDIMPGDATPDVDSNTFVVTGSLKNELFSSVQIFPNPFTPNDDGVNDIATFSYVLLKLTRKSQVKIEIYDIGGCLTRTLYNSKDINGTYSVKWDGRDDDGNLVPPGVYIYLLSVKADTGLYSKTGRITVVY